MIYFEKYQNKKTGCKTVIMYYCNVLYNVLLNCIMFNVYNV